MKEELLEEKKPDGDSSLPAAADAVMESEIEAEEAPEGPPQSAFTRRIGLRRT